MSFHSPIFKDVEKLSPKYIPSLLPHRGEQMKVLTSLYTRKLENIGKSHSKACQLIGPVGTGKTACAINFGRRIEGEARKHGIKLKHIYLNCKVDGASRYKLYRNMLDKVAPEVSTQGLSSESMLHRLIRYLGAKDTYLLITVDEVGYFYKLSNEQVVYDLTRLEEVYANKPCHVLGTVFIARDVDFHKMLDESELSTLGRFPIRFPRYGEKQIFDILYKRAAEALQPTSFNEEIIHFVSELVTKPPVNGDIRVALDLLLYSGNLAENKGKNEIQPDHVRLVYSETHPTITTQDILDLNKHKRLMLLAIVRSLESGHSPYVSLPEMREGYAVACEEYGIKPQKNIEEIIEGLINRQMVEMRSLTRFTISDVPAEKLRKYLNGLYERLKHGFNQQKRLGES